MIFHELSMGCLTSNTCFTSRDILPQHAPPFEVATGPNVCTLYSLCRKLQWNRILQLLMILVKCFFFSKITKVLQYVSHKLLKNSDFRSDQKFILNCTHAFTFLNGVSFSHDTATFSLAPTSSRDT